MGVYRVLLVPHGGSAVPVFFGGEGADIGDGVTVLSSIP